VTDNWRFLLHVCRTVDASPELRKRAVAGCRKFAGNRGRLLADLAHEWGVAEDKLNGLDSGAFTLQLVAFRERKNVEGFLAKLPLGDHTKDYGGAEVPGTRIYRETEKAVRLNYWNDFLSMSDPIYLTTHGDMTRIRYGLYATVADAECDRREWLRQYKVAADIVPVDITSELVKQVIFGDLPGVFAGRRY
jgi:hypothetical protein